MLRIVQNVPPEPVDFTAAKMGNFSLLSLEQFRAYWQVSQADLVLLTGASLSTVKRWSCRDPRIRLHPNFEHLYRLTLVNQRWQKLRLRGVHHVV